MRAASKTLLCVLVAGAALTRPAHAEAGVERFRDADCARLARPLRATCQLAAQNELPALVELGRAFANGRGVDRDDAQAVRAFRLAADQGNAQARLELAVLTADGRGVARDPDRATELLRLAAQQGLAEAQLRLATQYQLGRGVAQDYREAVAWLTRAAAQGNAPALTALGQAHEDGLGAEQDFARAAEYYRRAAAAGHAEAHWHLGALLEHGRGVARDLEQAAQHYRQAAAHGIAPAQSALGALLRDGRGVARNEAEALRLFRDAAQQGLAAAQFNLAQMLERNPATLVEAVRWYRAASANGVRQAETEIDRLLATASSAPQAPAPPAAPSADALDRHSENLFWQTAMQIGAAGPFEDYLRRWPRGQFASLAQAQLARLRQPQAAAPQQPDPSAGDADALRLFGYLADNGATPGAAALAEAIRRYQRHEGAEATGALGEDQRAQLLTGARILRSLLNVPPESQGATPVAIPRSPDARFRRGWQHETGQGAARNEAEAVHWYRLAASVGSREALNNLGLRYARGQGVSARDIANAFLLWRAAATRGDANAAFNLAVAYEQGIGGQPNLVFARIWYAAARDAGNTEARNALARLR